MRNEQRYSLYIIVRKSDGAVFTGDLVAGAAPMQAKFSKNPSDAMQLNAEEVHDELVQEYMPPGDTLRVERIEE